MDSKLEFRLAVVESYGVKREEIEDLIESYLSLEKSKKMHRKMVKTDKLQVLKVLVDKYVLLRQKLEEFVDKPDLYIKKSVQLDKDEKEFKSKLSSHKIDEGTLKDIFPEFFTETTC